MRHLGWERESFTTVDVLLPGRRQLVVLVRMAEEARPLPSWCRLTPIVSDDPIGPCLARLEEAREAVTVFLDGGPSDLHAGRAHPARRLASAGRAPSPSPRA